MALPPSKAAIIQLYQSVMLHTALPVAGASICDVGLVGALFVFIVKLYTNVGMFTRHVVHEICE